jgi:hypothetical protein
MQAPASCGMASIDDNSGAEKQPILAETVPAADTALERPYWEADTSPHAVTLRPPLQPPSPRRVPPEAVKSRGTWLPWLLVLLGFLAGLGVACFLFDIGRTGQGNVAPQVDQLQVNECLGGVE